MQKPDFPLYDPDLLRQLQKFIRAPCVLRSKNEARSVTTPFPHCGAWRARFHVSLLWAEDEQHALPRLVFG